MAKCLNISSEFKHKHKHKIPRKDFCETKYEDIECFQSLDSILTGLGWIFEKMSEITANSNF